LVIVVREAVLLFSSVNLLWDVWEVPKETDPNSVVELDNRKRDGVKLQENFDKRDKKNTDNLPA
jgi:hypothetical protein